MTCVKQAMPQRKAPARGAANAVATASAPACGVSKPSTRKPPHQKKTPSKPAANSTAAAEIMLRGARPGSTFHAPPPPPMPPSDSELLEEEPLEANDGLEQNADGCLGDGVAGAYVGSGRGGTRDGVGAPDAAAVGGVRGNGGSAIHRDSRVGRAEATQGGGAGALSLSAEGRSTYGGIGGGQGRGGDGVQNADCEVSQGSRLEAAVASANGEITGSGSLADVEPPVQALLPLGVPPVASNEMPSSLFWVDHAKAVTELLWHARYGTRTLQSMASTVNGLVSRNESIGRAAAAAKASAASTLTEARTIATSLAAWKEEVTANTPGAIDGVSRAVAESKAEYGEALSEAYIAATSTADVFPDAAATTALLNAVIVKTQNISAAEAETKLNGSLKRTKRGAQEAGKPVTYVKPFNGKRSCIYMDAGKAGIDAWKKCVGFSGDDASVPEPTVEAAVKWFNEEKYLRSTLGWAGIVAGVTAAFDHLDAKSTFYVEPQQTGDIGYVRALGGHVAMISMKVRLRVPSFVFFGWLRGLFVVSGSARALFTDRLVLIPTPHQYGALVAWVCRTLLAPSCPSHTPRSMMHVFFSYVHAPLPTAGATRAHQDY